MHHFEAIYKTKAEAYQAFVDYEDYQGNIERTLTTLFDLGGLLKPGGTAVVLETMGTLMTVPQPPTPQLQHLYDDLTARGFDYRWFRTDYRFPSVESAAAHIGFFFGDALAREVRAKNKPIVPECTGIWYRQKPA